MNATPSLLPTARTTRGSTPGNSRRSAHSPSPTVTRSSTSSTTTPTGRSATSSRTTEPPSPSAWPGARAGPPGPLEAPRRRSDHRPGTPGAEAPLRSPIRASRDRPLDEEANVLQRVRPSKQGWITGGYGQRIGQISRPFRAEFNRLLAGWMKELQPRSMQRLARDRSLQLHGPAPKRSGHAPCSAPAVHRIPYDRPAHVPQMHADLLGASGPQLDAHQVADAEARNRLHSSPRGPPLGGHGHAFAIHPVPRDRRVNLEGLVEVSPDEGRVHPLHPPR